MATQPVQMAPQVASQMLAQLISSALPGMSSGEIPIVLTVDHLKSIIAASMQGSSLVRESDMDVIIQSQTDARVTIRVRKEALMQQTQLPPFVKQVDIISGDLVIETLIDLKHLFEDTAKRGNVPIKFVRADPDTGMIYLSLSIQPQAIMTPPVAQPQQQEQQTAKASIKVGA